MALNKSLRTISENGLGVVTHQYCNTCTAEAGVIHQITATATGNFHMGVLSLVVYEREDVLTRLTNFPDCARLTAPRQMTI